MAVQGFEYEADIFADFLCISFPERAVHSLKSRWEKGGVIILTIVEI